MDGCTKRISKFRSFKHLNYSISTAMFPCIFTNTVSTGFPITDLVEPLVSFTSRFDHNQHSTGRQHQHSDTGQCKCPAHVVVFPIRHPIATITSSSEGYDADETANGWKEGKVFGQVGRNFAKYFLLHSN